MVVAKDSLRLKYHCSHDIKTIVFARTSFNSGIVQIDFKIYQTEIGQPVLKFYQVFERNLSNDRQNKLKSRPNFLPYSDEFYMLQHVLSLWE